MGINGDQMPIQRADGTIDMVGRLHQPDDAARLRTALEFAIAVIESYQLDVRAPFPPGTTDARSLADDGFCQGTIYQYAVHRVRRLAGDVE